MLGCVGRHPEVIHRLLEHGVFFAGYGPTVYPTRHSAPDHLTLPGQPYALVRVLR
jgi:hypothetical protein